MVNNFLQSVDNALKIMEIFANERAELGVSELSRKMQLGKSTTYRLLATLERRGFVVQNTVNGKYKLGIKIANIGTTVLQRISITSEARLHMEELSNAMGESTHLALYNQGDITFIDKVNGRNHAIMKSIVGSNKQAYCTATGKMLLSWLPSEKLEEYLQNVKLQQITPYTIIDVVELADELSAIKKQGYSEDRQESEEGLVCYAAPIRNGTGEVIAAVSISGPFSRMTEGKELLVASIKNTAQNISKSCGFHL